MADADLLADQIAGSTFTVAAPVYTVLAAADLACLADRNARERCFAAVYDADIREYTLIIEREAGQAVPLEADKAPHFGYRLIRFNLLIPFEGVGFIAALAGAVAARGANLLAVSAYSCDYMLVKEEDLDRAVRGLKELGIRESTGRDASPFRK